MSLRASALVLLLASCSQRADVTAPHAAELPEGVVARVGRLDIPEESVRRIGLAQGLEASQALQRAVTDALFAASLEDSPSQRAIVEVARRSAHARALIEKLESGVRASGPPTDEEVATLTQERWQELDRPPTARTTHAVVLLKKPEDETRARALAERLAREVASARDAEEFLKRAQALPADGLEVRAERLPPVTADGRAYFPEGVPPGQGEARFDPDFSRAAAALQNPGEMSPIVKSAFGFHVILLEERLPESRVPLEERRALLAEDVFARRAQISLKKLVEELERATAIEVSRSADDLTSRVLVSP